MVAAADAPGVTEAVAVPEEPATGDPAPPVDFTSDAPVAAGPVVAPPVPAVDRSRPPVPPGLDDALARQGAERSGQAVVRVRIDENGRATVLRVVTASDTGLSDACRATVHGSRWRPALDRAGIPVAREVSYTCAFEP